MKHFFTCLLLITITIFSCNKQAGGGGGTSFPVGAQLEANLIDGPWGLISSTTISSNGTANRYKGMPTDSLLFLYGADRNYNVVLTNMHSTIGNINMEYNFKLIQNKNNIVVCSPSWKDQTYSDSLFITSYSDLSLVFQVKYSNANDSGIEIDSLRKLSFGH